MPRRTGQLAVAKRLLLKEKARNDPYCKKQGVVWVFCGNKHDRRRLGLLPMPRRPVLLTRFCRHSYLALSHHQGACHLVVPALLARIQSGPEKPQP